MRGARPARRRERIVEDRHDVGVPVAGDADLCLRLASAAWPKLACAGGVSRYGPLGPWARPLPQPLIPCAI